MFLSKQLAGKRGESLAVSFLRKRKYQIIGQNFRVRNGEIDIIAIDTAEKEKILVFVEVKTRTSEQFGKPIESITPWKVEALYRSLKFYKHTHPKTPEILRIDAISVVLDRSGELVSIEHTKNITG